MNEMKKITALDVDSSLVEMLCHMLVVIKSAHGGGMISFFRLLATNPNIMQVRNILVVHICYLTQD